MGQSPQQQNPLDSLIGTWQFATAYPLAQEQYRQAQATGGRKLLEAAFYLTSLDYAYSKDATDSALMRYRQLVDILRGTDRAMAYAYLFQTYSSYYDRHQYRLTSINQPSDDPNLKYPLWHYRRMEDTLKMCADSVLAYAEALRDKRAEDYRLGIPTASKAPIMDTSLLGMLVQTLLTPIYERNMTSTWLLPLPEFCQQTSPSALSFPLNLYRQVAELYLHGSADMMLWLDLRRFALYYDDSIRLVAIDELAHYYEGKIKSDEMKALLALHKAKYLDYLQRELESEQLCVETEKAYPNTYGASSCQELRRDICRSTYEIKYKTTESSKRSRIAYVEACNLPLLSFRIIKRFDILGIERKNQMDTLLRLPALAEWQQPLPDPGDHLTHKYLIALPPMPQGDYYLVTIVDSTYKYSEFQSTDAAFITYDMPGTSKNLTNLHPSSGYLIDRVTGMPLINKKVTLQSHGIATSHKYQQHCQTNKEGYFHFPISSPSYLLWEDYEITADMDDYEYFYQHDGWQHVSIDQYYYQKKPSKKIEIVMTDRPIYRPGDTVSFCCVAYERDNRGEEWKRHLQRISNLELQAIFGVDYSDEKDTLLLTTDKHGRCWGDFVIPKEGRNGHYCLTIKSPDGGYRTDRHINVEAYKPPRFTVSLSTTSGDSASKTGTAFRFGQPITIYGTAVSYSGAPMTGAKVKWEVSCERMSNPLTYFSIADVFPYCDSLVMDDDGLFQITFTLERTNLKDDYSKLNNQTYIYTAYVRVTDADGELHEQQLSFHVGDVDGYCMLTSDDLSHLTYVYNNFNSQPMKGDVRVEVYQLRQPDTLRTLDPIIQEHPDAQWVGSREEFYRLFPHKAFSREECDRKNWPVIAKCYDQTTAERKIAIADLSSGVYRIDFTTPDGGHYDTTINHVALGGRVTGDKMIWVRTTPKEAWSYYNNITCTLGDTVKIELGSPYGHQPLYYCVTHASKTYKKGMMLLDSSHISTLIIPITHKMEDGCVVSLAAMREGSKFNTSYVIHVLRPDRQLEIATESFRDRLQPGEREQWRLRITSPSKANDPKNGNGVAANLCLSLYDQSLEQYNQHRYGFTPWERTHRELHTVVDCDYTLYEEFRWSETMHSFSSCFSSKPLLGFALPNMSDYPNQIVNLFNPVMGSGVIVDNKTNEPLPFVAIVLKRNGKPLSSTQTDFDGHFSFKNIPDGEYEMEVSSIGYHRYRQKIVFKKESSTNLNIQLEPSSVALEEVMILEGKTPVIEIGDAQSSQRISPEDIARIPAVGGVGYQDGASRNVPPKAAIAEIAAMFNFEGIAGNTPVNIRKNLSTLAFFEPALRSDDEGHVEVSFFMPDALTQWRLHGFAWTDEFQVGYLDRTVYTQKELMVQPQLPRFLRQGDTTEIRAKVSNLTDNAMEIVVKLDVEGETRSEALTIPGQSSGIAAFLLPVGKDWHVANYKIVASATQHGQGHLSDGEQGQLPVLSNRERITQSRLIYIAGTTDSSKASIAEIQFPISNLQFPLDSLSITFHPNPIKYAIQALPHFKRHRMPGNLYLANSIYVNHLISQISPLSEKERKRMTSSVKSDLHQLLQSQTSGGGWSWMPGSKTASRYVTESILQRLSTCPSLAGDNYDKRYYLQALTWLDQELVRQYNAENHSSINYPPFSLLYTRSLYLDVKPLEKCDSITRVAYDHYYRLCKMISFEDIPLSRKGHLALLMLHMGDTVEAVELANRIKGSAHIDDSLGMYWVSNVSGYGWYQRPIETAALMVDIFADVLHDWESVNRIQQWILSSKQGTTWKTDMATAHAIAALVRQPSWNAGVPGGTEQQATLTINGQPYDTLWNTGVPIGTDRQATLQVHLTNPSPYPAWGAFFVSREMHIDSISYDGTGINLRKTFSRVEADGSQHLLDPESKLQVGDKVRVHIDIHCERDMDNMVLSDQRAAAFEPVSTASGWQWNNGLRFYVDVRDDRLDCYIDRINEGHYYVEYDLWVRHSGTFANGIGILRSVYAPEFRANTPSNIIHIGK